MKFQFSPEQQRKALGKVNSLGSSRLDTPQETTFEAHFLENKQFLVFDGPMVASVYNVRFIDGPKDRPFVGGVRIASRGLSMDSRIIGLSERFPIDYKLLEAFQNDDLLKGLPLGIITEEKGRISEVLALGQNIQRDFCVEISVPDFGLIRFYTGIKDVIAVTPPRSIKLN